jgi:hypothetical protein
MEMVRDFWDLRRVPPVIREMRRAPFIGPSFISYPFIGTRNLLPVWAGGKGYLGRNPFGAAVWMFPAALIGASYQAITGKSNEEVEENRLLAAGGNEAVAEMLTPMFDDADGRTWHWNLAAAGAWDLVRSMSDPSARLMKGGSGNEFIRGLFAQNPMMSNVLNLGGYSPYTGRPASNFRWWHFMLAATPATGVGDIVRRERIAEADKAAGKAPLRTPIERVLQGTVGVQFRTSGAPGSRQRTRQASRSRYQERLVEFMESGGAMSTRPRRPAPDADEELLQAYRELTRRR